MPSNEKLTSLPIHLRAIGLLLVATIVATYLSYHNISNIFWLCNISALLAGVALLIGKRQLALIGATFMILGLACWLLNVVVNKIPGDPVSYIKHFSYGCIAVYLFFRFRVGCYLWLGCFCWYILAQVLSRIFTSPAENINLAFSVWPGWEVIFSNFFPFWCFVTVCCLVFLFVMNKIIYRLQEKRMDRSFPRRDKI